jgi:glycogen operon protein
LNGATKSWHGVRLDDPDWGDNSHSIALRFRTKESGMEAYWIFNAYWEPLEFELPATSAGGPWRRWIDTGLDSPDDIVAWESAPVVAGDRYRAQCRSVVMLFAESVGTK